MNRSSPKSPRLDWLWLRWLLTLFPFAAVAALIFKPELRDYFLPLGAAYGVAVSAYFAQILFLRLQCSLLDLMAFVAIFGAAWGLVFSTPGARYLGLWLAPVLAAWVLHGMVTGLARAQLLGKQRGRERLWQFFVALLGDAGPALIATGALMIFLEQKDASMLTRDLRFWSVPLPALGLVGLVLSVSEYRRASRAAKNILNVQMS